MHTRALFLWLTWMALALCHAQDVSPNMPAPPPTSQEKLDGGLLEPQWFGPDPVWTRDWRVDFFWARPGVRFERPVLYLVPWEEPRFLSSRDALDHACGGEATEVLQALILHRLQALRGLELASSPDDTPYHVMGRVVEATFIREGARSTFGILAGLPTQTWDFKVVDVRTGTTLLASHHRSVMGGGSTWFSALESPLRELAGLPPIPAWEMPPDSQVLEGSSRVWATPGLRLPAEGLSVDAWTADGDSGGINKAWVNGMGAMLARSTWDTLRSRMDQQGLSPKSGGSPVYCLNGQIFSSLKWLRPRYRAWITEVATGKVVARYEVLAPFSRTPGESVGQKIAAHLETLKEPLTPPLAEASSPGQTSPPQPVPTVWEGREHLVQTNGQADWAWMSPRLHFKGRTLQIADWTQSGLGPEADHHDRANAALLCFRAPGWLFGALAGHQERGFRISRQAGDLRLEGRILRLHQADLRKFGTMMAAAFTFGLATKSEGLLQVRVVNVQTGETLALAEQELASFQMASSGVSYKAMKWLALDLVPLLLMADDPKEKPTPVTPPKQD